MWHRCVNGAPCVYVVCDVTIECLFICGSSVLYMEFCKMTFFNKWPFCLFWQCFYYFIFKWRGGQTAPVSWWCLYCTSYDKLHIGHGRWWFWLLIDIEVIYLKNDVFAFFWGSIIYNHIFMVVPAWHRCVGGPYMFTLICDLIFCNFLYYWF
jgi:hypothetical protein